MYHGFLKFEGEEEPEESNITVNLSKWEITAILKLTGNQQKILTS